MNDMYTPEVRKMTPYELEQVEIKEEIARVEYKEKLEKGFRIADVFVNRGYLDNFFRADIITERNWREINSVRNLRMCRISKIVFDEKEDVLDKLTSLYNAMYNVSASVAVFIVGGVNSVSFYLAVRSDANPVLAGQTMTDMLRGNFPGVKLEEMTAEDIETFMEEAQKPDEDTDVLNGLGTVSMIPSLRDEKEKDKFVQGMEKFINTMQHKKYMAVLLSVPLDHSAIINRKHGYEQLFSSLSPHAKLSYAYGENSSTAVNEGVSRSFTDSVNESVSNTNSRNSSQTNSSSTSYTSGSSSGGGVSGDGFSANWGSSSSTSSSTSSSYTSGVSFSNSVSKSVGSSAGKSVNEGTTETTGKSNNKTINFENKSVSDLMKNVEEQIERIRQWESYGLWENCADFFADNAAEAGEATTAYKAIMTGEKSAVEAAHVNIWDGSNEMMRGRIKGIFEHVKHLVHPKAELRILDEYQTQLVSPVSMVSGKELSLLMGFPRKSVSGLAVQEMAEFGRDVVYENKIPKKTISFGNIYHMGIEETQSPVKMDLELFSSHCFITGSSGSGKSYATYNLIDRLLNNGIKMLAVEPAKGEYKQVFGGMKGINIFTMDMNTYRFLRINPFQFPDNIHILSHIEQLLQIFNASWPLYAAMPAILKESVVKAYQRCGWDIQNSMWIEGISDRKYPIFDDVLEVLPDIINNSDYSADSQGDYKGALLTRVQGMTTGINGMVFRKSEGISDEVLFDQNTIIDLSEAGSEETIALIMGVLIMKLNEYRKAQRKRGVTSSHDSSLQHVTVLEEAHNILKRTSKDQNQEGSNMVGKSVEMISNSIKEMRTYGEGFLIIDQSPLAVDSSVVENTATKIIMNTPSEEACKELGSALALEKKQSMELSRLNVGVAAVMQKGWMTPVLMKVGLWDPHKYEKELQYENRGVYSYTRSRLVKVLVQQIRNEKYMVRELSDVIRSSELPQDRRDELSEITLMYRKYREQSLKLTPEMLGNLFLEIIGCSALFDIVPTTGICSPRELGIKLDDMDEADEEEFHAQIMQSAGEWKRRMEKALDRYISVEDEEKRCALMYMLAVKGDKGENLDNIFSLLYMLLVEFGEDA